MIAGLVSVPAGSIRRPAMRQTPRDDIPLHLAGHLPGFRDSETPRGHLRYFAKLSGVPVNSVADVLKSVGLEPFADLVCGRLSAGQRKRLALARARLVSAPLMLLDEPGAALDKEGDEVLRMLLETYLAAGGIAVCATHDPLPVTPTRSLALESYLP